MLHIIDDMMVKDKEYHGVKFKDWIPTVCAILWPFFAIILLKKDKD
jgi:hypothetical protein